MAALPENLALLGEKGCDEEDHPRSERWCEVDALFDQVSISLSAFMYRSDWFSKRKQTTEGATNE